MHGDQTVKVRVRERKRGSSKRGGRVYGGICMDGKVLHGKVMLDGSKIVLLWNDGELLPGTVH